MEKNLIIEDRNYISARRAASIFGYTSDYIGQLCRAGKLECKMIGRSWFVSQDSIAKYQVAVSPEMSPVMDVVTNDVVAGDVVESDIVKNIEVNTNVEVKKEIPAFISFEPVNYLYPNAVSNLELNPSGVNIPLNQRMYLNSSLSSNNQTNSKTFLGIGMVAIVFVIFIQLSFISKNSFITNSSTAQPASVSSASKELVRELVLLLTSIPKMAFNIFTPETNNSLVINTDDKTNLADDPPDSSGFNGLAVTQSTGSEAKDEILKQKIRDSFSDEVRVKQDQTGTSGVITPVFKKVAGNGNDFIYVLVPVANQLKN